MNLDVLPKHLLLHLTEMYLQGLNPAWVLLHNDGITIAEIGGDWAYYCNPKPRCGDSVEVLNVILSGLFPITDSFRLSQVEVDGGVYLDIDILQHDGCAWVLFTDVTNTTLRLQQMQQASNSIQLKQSRLDGLLDRYVGRSVVDKVSEGQLKLNERGERRNITTLFVDVRNFTVFNESHDAQVVMSTINQYMDEMLQPVLDCDGLIDKITGDGAMALFGVIAAERKSPCSALKAAVAVMDGVRALNIRRKQQSLQQLNVGIGIASGGAVLGAVGTHRRRTFTAFGAHVNLAARLEGSARGGEVIIDAATLNELSVEQKQSFSAISLNLKGIGDVQAWRMDTTSH